MRDVYYISIPGGGSAAAELEEGEFGEWWINKIYVPYEDRGYGVGSTLLSSITQDADLDEVELRLEAHPYGEKGLDRQQLIDWYGRFGFELDPEENHTKLAMGFEVGGETAFSMVREPQNAETTAFPLRVARPTTSPGTMGSPRIASIHRRA